jgi:ABC-2 type transport system ATP-binding protein
VLLTTQYLEEADRLAGQLVVLDHGRVIATGTSAPLAAALAGLGSGAPVTDGALGRVVVPVADGPAVLPEVAARLAAGGLCVADLALRRPTLDDVFLALTGQPTGQDAPPDAGHQDQDGAAPAA